MSDLVTPAVRDAALNAVFECDQGEDVRYAILRAVAPLIGAETLRQAASAQRQQYASGRMGTITALWLEARADELEDSTRRSPDTASTDTEDNQ